jgi:hypothetical protein
VNALGAVGFLLMMIGALCLADSLSPRNVPAHHHVHRHEICPGAEYFYSGPPPDWAKDKRVVCRIGRHTFVADK